ncbi:hypothetical protein SCHPADRAFT_933467 [Schizopora paradoxa]|uniref:F-box domain-containing protein n=1 Tax=Schizopora paradoxa TaxID=27342 RepID=A0A0H2R892_9AGAM|nr:hypothetical protein SCHPADRAFT_933467 [Schizopora paradoxa]
MTTIHDIPVEILCAIFSLASREPDSSPSIFKTGDDFQDCVVLIDLSRVCRYWRDTALENPTLWSSLRIRLIRPSDETLLQVTHFLELPRPLIHALVSHCDRFSKISLDIAQAVEPQPYWPRTLVDISKAPTDYVTDLCHATFGGERLEELHFIWPWFPRPLESPLPALKMLRIASYQNYDVLDPMAKWLPLALNLEELEIIDRSFSPSSNVEEWKKSDQHFLLSNLRSLTASPSLLPHFICPNLAKYAMRRIPWESGVIGCFENFIDRSDPPLHTLEIKEGFSFSRENAIGFLKPRFTTIIVTSPHNNFFSLLSMMSEGGDRAYFLPALKHIELREVGEKFVYELSDLVELRWDVGASHRTLESVKLRRSLESMPEALLHPGDANLDITSLEVKWRRLARRVKQGLIISREECT